MSRVRNFFVFVVWFSLMLFIVNRKYKEDVRESNFFGKKK